MTRWQKSSVRSLRQGHRKLAKVLRGLGARGRDLSTWTVKQPVYSPSLARYTVSSSWFDSDSTLWRHKFEKFKLHREEGVKTWRKVFVRKGLLYAIRITVFDEGYCKVDMTIGAEQAPF